VEMFVPLWPAVFDKVHASFLSRLRDGTFASSLSPAWVADEGEWRAALDFFRAQLPKLPSPEGRAKFHAFSVAVCLPLDERVQDKLVAQVRLSSCPRPRRGADRCASRGGSGWPRARCFHHGTLLLLCAICWTHGRPARFGALCAVQCLPRGPGGWTPRPCTILLRTLCCVWGVGMAPTTSSWVTDTPGADTGSKVPHCSCSLRQPQPRDGCVHGVLLGAKEWLVSSFANLDVARISIFPNLEQASVASPHII
jgi:hypothetical protein